MTEMPSYTKRRGPLTFRALTSAKTRRLNKKAGSLADLSIEVFRWLSTYIALPATQLPSLRTKEHYSKNDLEEIAIECRSFWGLGNRPIHKLGELIQSKGILVAKATFGDVRFDAFSCVIDGSPIIFLGSEKKDRARSRFDAAHEWGHVVLHQHWTDSDLLEKEIHSGIEEEANYFASAFLLPKDSFSQDVEDLTLNGFLQLKAKWGVSAQAMIRRARDLELIDETTYRNLFCAAAARGMRKAGGEPHDDLVPELSLGMARKSLELLESSQILKREDLTELLPFPPEVFIAAFALDAAELRPAPPQIIQFPRMKLIPNNKNDNDLCA
jgi:Zn-dependent peptidase ImmA (M78 family)